MLTSRNSSSSFTWSLSNKSKAEQLLDQELRKASDFYRSVDITRFNILSLTKEKELEPILSTDLKQELFESFPSTPDSLSETSSVISDSHQDDNNSNNNDNNFSLKPLVLYKTELCSSFIQSGHCTYSDKCQFAHGAHELRSVNRHPKFKSQPCRNFVRTGKCSYGHRCCFKH